MMREFNLENLKCFVDLHLHLDGSLSFDNVKSLAAEQGIFLGVDDDELVSKLSVDEGCRDLNEYLQKFDFPLKLLQTSRGIQKAVKNLRLELEKLGVMYAEIRFAPQLHKRAGLTQEEVLESALKGLEGEGAFCNLIICCMRGDNTQEDNFESVELAGKYLGRGVCAIDLAGAEGLFPNKLFKGEITRAGELGIPITLHAGEADGYESVGSAISMGAQRIGHGVRAAENDELLDKLAKEGVFLEICPTSNLNTKVFAALSELPIRKFIKKGIRFGINTDNMSVSRTNVQKEWIKTIKAFGIEEEEMRKILMDSVDASFAKDEHKLEMKRKIEEEFEKISK